MSTVRSVLSEVGWLLLVVWALPFTIVAVALPVVALVAMVLAVFSRL